MSVLQGAPGRIITVVLLIQAAAYYAVASRTEITPASPPLADFPRSIGSWSTQQEYPLEKEVADVLRADDTLNRVYVNSADGKGLSFFIAFFKTQRYGQSPHSPKNCLPGSGWQPIEDGKISVKVSGREEPIVVNKYVIARGDQKSLVLYWYQSHQRVIAGEFAAKFWLVADAMRYRRSDTALIRVITPIEGSSDQALSHATGFVSTVFPSISAQLP